MTIEERRRIVGKNIRTRMRKRGMTQFGLATRAHVSQACVREYLNGEREIGIGSLTRIADALGCSWEDLLEGAL
jgi:transcriptional regulator with XRE-family HTH domain